MTRTMYDSVTVTEIPAGAKMVAGYVDGHYANVPALHRRFPHATVVTITVTGQPGANVCDTEPGNISIDGAAQWAANEVKAGRHPTIYCMASQWAAVKRAINSHGVGKHVSYWVADYDGKAKVPRGAVAKQYLGSPGNSPGHYDVSVVRSHWPGVDPVKRTSLRAVSRVMVKRLTRSLSHRRRPLTPSSDRLLHELEQQIRRARAIKDKQ